MDPSRILIWNVRGLNSSSRQGSLRSLVDSSRSDIVCVQETKIADISRRIILSSLGADFSDYIVVPSVGASGGILIAWRHHIGVSGVQRVDNNRVTIQFAARDGQAWWLTCVYGP